MALYTLVVVALYPAFEHSTSLDKLVQNDSAAAALFGITGKISSSGGWLNANIYANFFPLVMLVLTVGYGAASIAGQHEEGTLSLIMALPLRRRRIVAQKMGAMVLQAVVLSVGVAICVLAGRSFDLSVTPSKAGSISPTVLLLGLDFGIITMAVGALTGRRGTAIGIGAALAAVSFLASSLAPVAAWTRLAGYASPFYWSVGQNQVTAGASPEEYAILVLVGLCVASAAVIGFRRLDVR